MIHIISTVIVNTLEETENLASHLSSLMTVGDVIYLKGTLGAGKSTFARSFIRALSPGKTIDVPSPTFTLVQTYEDLDTPVWHYDLYRLESPEEIYEVGIEESLTSAISLIEWPERLGTITLPDPLWIDIHLDLSMGSHHRTITFSGSPKWEKRLSPFNKVYGDD